MSGGATAVYVAAAVAAASAVYTSEQQKKQAEKTASEQRAAEARTAAAAEQAENEANARKNQEGLDQATSETATVKYGKEEVTDYQDSSDLLVPRKSINLGTGSSGTTRTGIGF